MKMACDLFSILVTSVSFTFTLYLQSIDLRKAFTRTTKLELATHITPASLLPINNSIIVTNYELILTSAFHLIEGFHQGENPDGRL